MTILDNPRSPHKLYDKQSPHVAGLDDKRLGIATARFVLCDRPAPLTYTHGKLLALLAEILNSAILWIAHQLRSTFPVTAFWLNARICDPIELKIRNPST